MAFTQMIRLTMLSVFVLFQTASPMIKNESADKSTDKESKQAIIVTSDTSSSSKCSVNKLGQTKLHIAALHCDLEAAMEAVEEGVGLDIQDKAGCTALMYAVDLQKRKIMNYLLQRKANVNIQDCRGYSPLHQAVLNNDKATVIVLLLLGADKTLKSQKVPPPCPDIDEITINALGDAMTPRELAVNLGYQDIAGFLS